MIPVFGREPLSLNALNRLRENHAYRGLAATVETVVQSVPRVRDQSATPSCVGQAIAAAVHALLGFDGSAINVWIDARRRDGNLDRADYGTYIESAIESLIKRGLDPFQPGEENQLASEYTQMPDLEEELAADDLRLRPTVERYITTGTLAKQRLAIVDALKSGKAVLWATGVKEPFFSLRKNQVATMDHVGADYNGHQMRVFLYDHLTDLFGVQNSWTRDFAGITFEGVEYPGCFWIEAKALIDGQWDTMILEMVRV